MEEKSKYFGTYCVKVVGGQKLPGRRSGAGALGDMYIRAGGGGGRVEEWDEV